MSDVVLILGLYLAVVMVQIVIFAKWVARVAELRGRDRRAWFYAGFLFGPLALIAAVLMPRVGAPRAEIVAASPGRPFSVGRIATRVALVGVPLIFVSIFFLYPVGSIIWRGLTPDGMFSLAAMGDILTDGDLRSVAWFTLWQAAVSTVVTLAVALPGAYLISQYKFKGRALLRAAITVPLILPTVVVGVAFLTLAGPQGAIGVDLKGTVWIILLAHAFYNYAVVVRTVGGMWSHLDPRMEQAARVLGAGRIRAFVEVTLPLLRPAIAAAASIVFLFSFTSFGVILILGAPRRVTLEVEIFRQTAQLLNLETAAALAILQLLGVFVILTIYSRYQERRSVELNLRPVSEVERAPATSKAKLVVAANLALMGALLFLPLGVLVKRSFTTSTGLGLTYYRNLVESSPTSLPVPPTEAIRNSLFFAVIAALIALTVGGLAAIVVGYGKSRYSRWFDSLLMLPLGTSAVTVGVRLPDLARQGHSRFTYQMDTDPHRARTGRHTVRYPRHGAHDSIDRQSITRGGGRAGREPGSHRTGDRLPHCRQGHPRRGRLCRRHLPWRVRGDDLYRPSRRADVAGGDLPADRPPGGAQLRYGDGYERHPDGGHWYRDDGRRALPGRGRRRFLRGMPCVTSKRSHCALW